MPDIEQTSAGFQAVIPGCERRTAAGRAAKLFSDMRDVVCVAHAGCADLHPNDRHCTFNGALHTKLWR